MLKQMFAVFATAATVAVASAPATAADRWEYQGIASTGERVYLNLDSVRFYTGRGGFFQFVYQIGRDRPKAVTLCDGGFKVVNPDGTGGPFMRPQSRATWNMLDRVCSFPRG